jgi:hypothetical protein
VPGTPGPHGEEHRDAAASRASKERTVVTNHYRDHTPLTAVAALSALHRILRDHEWVTTVVGAYASWGELAAASPVERASRIGPWAAALQIPPQCPTFNPPTGITVTGRWDPAYSHLLAQRPDAPVLLYGVGVRPQRPLVAIGGSHHPSPEGLRAARNAARVAVSLGCSVTAAADGGCGQAALDETMRCGGVALAVIPGDLTAPGRHAGLVQRLLRRGGGAVSEWGPGETASDNHLFLSQRIVGTIGDAVVLAELGIHPDGGAHLARAAIAADRFLVVPAPEPDPLISPTATGGIILGRAHAFSASVFGSSERAAQRSRDGQPVADAVVATEEGLRAALRLACGL